MTLNEAYIHTADDNELSDLEAEYLNESLLGSVEDEAIVPRVNASEQAYDADEDFTGLQASDEIKITKKLPDGSQVSQVVTKDLLNAQGITDAEIAQGFPAGDETVILEAVSEENE
jgi:hypothetical protein